MPFVVASPTSTSSEEEIVKAALQRQTAANGYIQLPSSSQILERLYNDHGVRVRMIRRNRPKKIPTVRELIDHLSKKHERLLEIQAKGAKIEKNTIKDGIKDGRRVSLESLDTETPRNSLKKKPAKADGTLSEGITSKDNIRKQPWKSDVEMVDADSNHKRKPLNLFVGTDKRTEGCESPGDGNKRKAKRFEDVLSDGVTIPHKQTLDLFIGNDKRAEDVVATEPRWKLDLPRRDDITERNHSKDSFSW